MVEIGNNLLNEENNDNWKQLSEEKDNPGVMRLMMRLSDWSTTLMTHCNYEDMTQKIKLEKVTKNVCKSHCATWSLIINFCVEIMSL